MDFDTLGVLRIGSAIEGCLIHTNLLGQWLCAQRNNGLCVLGDWGVIGGWDGMGGLNRSWTNTSLLKIISSLSLSPGLGTSGYL